VVKEVAEKELLSRFNRARVMDKADGSLVTDADLMMQQELTRLLAERWPEIAMLGEEMTSEEHLSALKKDRFWCLDPLDGTTNFASGLPYFAVSLALIEQGEVICGVVYDPVRQESFRADRGRGAWLNDEPLEITNRPSQLAACIGLIDLKRVGPDVAVKLIQSPPFRSHRNFGAVALEWCWMASGRAQLYLHGGQKLWDYAAGRLVFLESGGSAYGVADDELPLTLDSIPAFAASSEELQVCWQQWLQKAGFSFS